MVSRCERVERVNLRVRFGMCRWTRGRRPWPCGGGKALAVLWTGYCSPAGGSEWVKERREVESVILGEFGFSYGRREMERRACASLLPLQHALPAFLLGCHRRGYRARASVELARGVSVPAGAGLLLRCGGSAVKQEWLPSGPRSSSTPHALPQYCLRSSLQVMSYCHRVF